MGFFLSTCPGERRMAERNGLQKRHRRHLGIVSQLSYHSIVPWRRRQVLFREGHTMIIRTTSCSHITFSNNNLFSFDQIDGIELNGGEDYFGDEILRKLPGLEPCIQMTKCMKRQ